MSELATEMLAVAFAVLALAVVALSVLLVRRRGTSSAEHEQLVRSRQEADQLRSSLAQVRSEAERDVAAERRSAEEARGRALDDARATAGRELASSRERAETELELARTRLEHDTAALRTHRGEVEAELRSNRTELRDQRTALERREQRLTEREARLDATADELERRGTEQVAEAKALEVARAELADVADERQRILEATAGLTADDAKHELVATIEQQAKREAALHVREIEGKARAEAQQTARTIVTGAIQRVASEQTAEAVVSVVHLPGDEMKGRIIGREGRNIRTFELVTGVNVIIDDTPEAVLLSSFDPVRREVARITLEALVADGRIHPQRIEDAYERSVGEVEHLCQRAGEDAILAVGVADLHPQLVKVLGQLRFRTSYGQNVLKHLVETAHLAGLMAAEIGVRVDVVKRAAFLHDIGKALTHEVEGTHAMVGADLARRYGEHEDVVHAIEAHHNEVDPRTVEAVLTQAADAISGSRPGARRESLEAYVRRLERIEEIAHQHDGVDKVFAMQAGREVRVMVQPDVVDDLAAQVLARDIAKEIESELTYPGQIRVMVVRESRAVETAR